MRLLPGRSSGWSSGRSGVQGKRIAGRLSGRGLQLLEAPRLRMKDLNHLDARVLAPGCPVAGSSYEGVLANDRHVVLPRMCIAPLRAQIEDVRKQFQQDFEDNAGFVALPDAYLRKSPSAARSWQWQWVFPAARGYIDPKTGNRYRHHLHETTVQKTLGHANVKTTMIYTQALTQEQVTSPLDAPYLAAHRPNPTPQSPAPQSVTSLKTPQKPPQSA